MRKKLLALGLFCFAYFNTTAAKAIPLLPVGAYTLTLTTGNNPGGDVGTVSGKVIFDDSSNITFADVTFNDITAGKVFTFTNPGPTFIMTSPELVGASIFNAVDPNQFYLLSALFVPRNPSGSFDLTQNNSVGIDLGGPFLTLIGVTGIMTPAAVPEPGTFMLLGTGALAVFGSRRRFFQQ